MAIMRNALRCVAQIGLLLALTACAPSSSAIATAVHETEQAPRIEYANQMAEARNALSLWLDGPVAEWNEDLSSSCGPSCVMPFPIVTCRVWVEQLCPLGCCQLGTDNSRNLERRIGQAAQQIAEDGFVVLSKLGAVTPPPEVSVADSTVMECVKHRVETSREVMKILSDGHGVDLDAGPCLSLPGALAQIDKYISQAP
jgi:hypothetical protein